MGCYDVVYIHVVEIKLDAPNPSSYLNKEHDNNHKVPSLKIYVHV